MQILFEGLYREKTVLPFGGGTPLWGVSISGTLLSWEFMIHAHAHAHGGGSAYYTRRRQERRQTRFKLGICLLVASKSNDLRARTRTYTHTPTHTHAWADVTNTSQTPLTLPFPSHCPVLRLIHYNARDHALLIRVRYDVKALFRLKKNFLPFCRAFMAFCLYTTKKRLAIRPRWVYNGIKPNGNGADGIAVGSRPAGQACGNEHPTEKTERLKKSPWLVMDSMI